MTPEEMVVNMAEATARLNAPGYGDPVAKVRELVEHAGRNQIPIGNVMETQAYADLTDAEAGAFLAFAILDRMGIASVIGGQNSANVAAAIIGTLIIHGGFERPAKR